MATQLDFSTLLSRNNNHRPSRVAQLVPREALRPIATTTTPSTAAATTNGETNAIDKAKIPPAAGGNKDGVHNQPSSTTTTTPMSNITMKKKKAVYKVNQNGLSSTLLGIVDDDDNFDMSNIVDEEKKNEDDEGDIYIVDVMEEESMYDKGTNTTTNPVSSSSEDDDEEDEELAEPMDIDENDNQEKKKSKKSAGELYNDVKAEPSCLATHSWSFQDLTKHKKEEGLHPNVAIVREIASSSSSSSLEKEVKHVIVSRFQMGESLPTKLNVPRGNKIDSETKSKVNGVHSHSGYYTFPNDNGNDDAIHWHVNFASNSQELFPSIREKSTTTKHDDLYLTQEDHLLLEHPMLSSLSQALDDKDASLPKGLNRCTRQKEDGDEKSKSANSDAAKEKIISFYPTPILVRNIPRQCSINLLPPQKDEKNKTLSGKEFYKALSTQIKQGTTCINPPTKSNVVSLSTTTTTTTTPDVVRKKNGKKYTKKDIIDLFGTLYTAFRAVVLDSIKKDGKEKGPSVVIHTGFGESELSSSSSNSARHNKGLTAVLQILAAGTAGVETIHFYNNDGADYGENDSSRNDVAFRHAMEVSKAFITTSSSNESGCCSTEDIVNKLIKIGYRWGDVSIPSHVTFASTVNKAAADNDEDGDGGILSLLSPSDNVEMAGKDEKVDAVGEIMSLEDIEEEEKRRQEEQEMELQDAARRDMEFFRIQTERTKKSEELAFGLSRRTAEYERHAADHDDDEEDKDEDNDGNKKKKKKLESVLPSWVGADDDDPERRAQLERRRAREEARISPQLHEIELGDWEQNIDWEGAASPSGGGGDGMSGVVVEGGADVVPTASSPGVVGVGIKDPKGDKSPAMDQTAKNNPNAATSSSTGSVDPISLLHRPLNLSLDALDLTNTISWEGADASPGHNHAIASRVNLILHESVAGRSMARLAAPIQRPEPFTSTAVFGARCERELSENVTSTAVSVVGTLNPDSEKLEKIIEARQKKRAQMAKDKSTRVTEAMGTLALGGGKGRTITSSLMGPGGTERTGRPSRHADSSSAHDAEYVEQLELVYNHTLVKPDLNKSELRHFHRPRLPARGIVRAGRIWQFQVRCSASTSTSGPKGASDGSTVGSYHAMMSAHHGSASHGKIRNEADLSASEGNLVLFEYCEERPPVQMSKGMACRIVNYYRGDKSRCPISAGGGDRPTRKRNWKKAVGAAGQGGPSGKVERPPRLMGPNQNEETSALDLIGTTGDSKVKATGSGPSEKEKEKKAKEPAVDLLPEGSTEILHPKVHGPFMGEIEEGMTQSGLISNIFAAPIFRHEPEPSDFLMILGKKPSYKQHHREGAPALGVFLRPFPSSTFCVGQTEPRVKVFAPNTTGEKTFQAPFVTYQIAKNLSRTESKEGRGLRFDEINDRLFANTVILPNALRQRIKQVASYDKNTQIWTTKPIGFEDFPGVEALGRRFSPEGVAAFETSRAAHRRLCDMGMHTLYSGSSSVPGVGAAMVYLTGSVNAARERKSKMLKMVEHAKALKGSTRPTQIALYEEAASKLEAAWKEIKKKHEVARFIYEELQLAPWHLTSEFIDVHKHAQGTGMMKLTGLGDPSGIGEAYNFLREQDAKPNKGTGNSDGALNAQIKKITGTENDLRKLTMKQMASLLRSYGMGDKEISTLKRWDRVHVIRDLSTKAASDGMGDGLERYARGEKMKLSDQKQMYRERINEIWRRQRAALSTDAGSFDMARGVGSSAGVPSAADDGVGDTDAATVQKQLEKDLDDSDSDSDDDDDFAATFEEDLMDVKTTNELMAAQVRGSGDGDGDLGAGGLRRPRREDTLEMSKDARDFAALQRQREEERAAQEGLLAKSGSSAQPNSDYGHTPYKSGRKCIRRRVTKTHPDGTQTTTFKFVVLPEEVEKLIAAKKKREEAAKKGNEKSSSKRKGHKASKHSEKKKTGGADNDRKIIGHSMFEDEDDVDQPRHKSNIKLQVHRSTRVITTKTKKVGHSSASSKAPPKPKKSKLQLGKHKEKKNQERRMKKRQREAEEADLYKRRGTSNRRERGAIRERRPHVIMADRLESIRTGIEKRPSSGPFHRPVNRKALPRYYEVISEPIDLQTIRDKNQRYEYKTADAFLRDFDLMKNNAIKFNGVGSFLGNEATEIYEFVKKIIAENREEFNAMETAVQEQLNSGRKRKKTSSSSKSAASDTTGTGSSAKTDQGAVGSGNVVLDGVAVAAAVDFGNIPTDFTFGGDGSDSDDST